MTYIIVLLFCERSEVVYVYGSIFFFFFLNWIPKTSDTYLYVYYVHQSVIKQKSKQTTSEIVIAFYS